MLNSTMHQIVTANKIWIAEKYRFILLKNVVGILFNIYEQDKFRWNEHEKSFITSRSGCVLIRACLLIAQKRLSKLNYCCFLLIKPYYVPVLSWNYNTGKPLKIETHWLQSSEHWISSNLTMIYTLHYAEAHKILVLMMLVSAKTPTSLFGWLVWFFMSQSTAMVMSGPSVRLPHFFLGTLD